MAKYFFATIAMYCSSKSDFYETAQYRKWIITKTIKERNSTEIKFQFINNKNILYSVTYKFKMYKNRLPI
ncbi:hypothetical protein PIL02S_04575 [Paenibacillus illinoisensis]|uniref:Uncharacterized protein n=1 Tax=Paenibacillus illinoisensis TaxID=59845 RepID=A0A2W0CCN3_9BACL|nr:hypothetical protein PIL02S_04575 [Paenibacillus illinoisensis]